MNSISVVTYLVPWYIYIKSGPFFFADNVKVWFSKLRPEFLMLVAMPWEVEHAGAKCNMQNLLHQQTTSTYKIKNTSISKHSPWIIFKTVLYPLTVMYIPVNYQHPENKHVEVKLV